MLTMILGAAMIALVVYFVLQRVSADEVEKRIRVYAGVDDVEFAMRELEAGDIRAKVRRGIADCDVLLVHRARVLLAQFRDEGVISPKDETEYASLITTTHSFGEVEKGRTNTGPLARRCFPWHRRACREKASEILRTRSEKFRSDLAQHRWMFRACFARF